jgi:DNA-binding LacI/PurR family transcriptional regulator
MNMASHETSLGILDVTSASKPIYERLVARYRKDILERRLLPGDRVDSIARIQKKFHVARETAKRVLNILESEGLVVQRAGKGSFVADLRPKEGVWGVVVPFFSVQFEDLLSRLSRLAGPLGREVRRFYDYNNWEEEIRLVGMMQAERYEAIVVIPTLDESRTWGFYARLSRNDSPVILFDHTMTYRDFTFVVQSYDLGVVRAMDYLLDRKPGGVAFVENEGWTGRNMVLELMVETYRMVLRRRRPGVEPKILERAGHVDVHDLRNSGITGVFCCDDVSAIQVIGRLREQGVRIPEAMSLVSYGNTDLARFFTPALTSVDPHNEEMVLRLLDVLTSDETDTPGQVRQYVVQPELVVRET